MILGSGGREHAMAKWFAEYGHEMTAAPGNAGTSELGENLTLNIMDFQTVAKEAIAGNYDLVVVGPETPLCNGIVDYWYKHNLPQEGIHIFGARELNDKGNYGAAMLEGSKIFARNFANKHGIPQPEYVGFRSGDHVTNHNQACSHWKYRNNHGKKKLMVIKADGLCGGKGVFMCDDDDQIFRSIRSLPQFKGQGDDFLMEEKLIGEEASITVVTDGKDYVMFPHSQDHKRRFDFDKGLNTGGMGAYAPTKLITPKLEEIIRTTMIEPTIEGMRKDGMVTPDLPLATTIYFAVMVVDNRPYLIEYNMRFGDPESQVVMPLMDGDPYMMMKAACEGKLGEVKNNFNIHPAYSACVVLVSEDYQNRGGASAKGQKITFKESLLPIDGVHLVHAGTKKEGDNIIVNGGRVLGVTAVSEASHQRALSLAYAATDLVHFDNSDMRTDIGYRVLGD